MRKPYTPPTVTSQKMELGVYGNYADKLSTWRDSLEGES